MRKRRIVHLSDAIVHQVFGDIPEGYDAQLLIYPHVAPADGRQVIRCPACRTVVVRNPRPGCNGTDFCCSNRNCDLYDQLQRVDYRIATVQ